MENILARNIKDAMKKCKADGKVIRKWGRIIIETEDYKKIKNALTRVFGIISFSPAIKIKLDELKEYIRKNAKSMVKGRTFAVRVKRSGIHPFTSKDMEIELGQIVVDETRKKVNLSKPDSTIHVEIRDDEAFIYSEIVKGVGGMPLGTENRVLCEISNKNDLVACWLMMKRGCKPIIQSKISTKILDKWSYGLTLKMISKKEYEKLKDLPKVKGYTLEKDLKKIKLTSNLVFMPLVAMKQKEINEIYNKIKNT